MTDRPDALAQTIHKALDQASEGWTPYGHQAAHDAASKLLRLLEQEQFERQQLADAYKRDLVLLEQITQERDYYKEQYELAVDALNSCASDLDDLRERARELEAELEQFKK